MKKLHRFHFSLFHELLVKSLRGSLQIFEVNSEVFLSIEMKVDFYFFDHNHHFHFFTRVPCQVNGSRKRFFHLALENRLIRSSSSLTMASAGEETKPRRHLNLPPTSLKFRVPLNSVKNSGKTKVSSACGGRTTPTSLKSSSDVT